MFYEHKKHDGSLPIVGVNTFLSEAEETEWKLSWLDLPTMKRKVRLCA